MFVRTILASAVKGDKEHYFDSDSHREMGVPESAIFDVMLGSCDEYEENGWNVEMEVRVSVK